MGITCAECGRRIVGQPKVSVTGRRLCADCHNRLLGATAGMMTGQSLRATLATSAATVHAGRVRRGLLARTLQRLRGRDSGGASGRGPGGGVSDSERDEGTSGPGK